MSAPAPNAAPLALLRSIKVKLGVLVVASVTVAVVIATVGARGGVAAWLTIPVTIAVALAVTQLLASGMTLPLREMTEATRRMARGDYRARVLVTSADEVGALARAFNRMAADLGSADAQRRDLIANVSHELRTPVAALSATLDNLADGVVQPSPETLGAARDQAQRVGALLADLLDLSRIEAGLVALDLQPLNVRRVLDAAVAESSVPSRHVSYEVNVEPPGLVVHADERRLRQVVGNVLDNATRHSPRDGVVRLTAQLSPGLDLWRLEVTDDGPGIPTGDRDRVFDRFGTGEDATGGGTGLGLAIARWVVGLHGGLIAAVDPDPGHRGARIRVELPVRPALTPPTTRPPTDAQPQEPTLTTSDTTSRPAAVDVRSLVDELFGRAWPDNAGRRRAFPIACLAAGLLAGIVVPDNNPGLGYFLVVLLGGGTVFLASKHRRDPFTIACSVLAGLLGGVLMLRDAGWIQALCTMAAIAIGLAGLVRARTVAAFVLAGLAWPTAGIRGLPWLGRNVRGLTRDRAWHAWGRTALWSLLGVIAFGALFISADALFAEWFDWLTPSWSTDRAVATVFVTVFIAAAVFGATYLGLNPPRLDHETAARPALPNRYEWLVPVLLVDAVFVAYLVAQATAFFGGDAYLERTTGLTYAEYVHQGFGQLTVATALTLLVVWAAQRRASRESPTDRVWLRASLGTLCALTLVVVASALYRMDTYQDAYGFTGLRLVVDVFEGWLGLVVLAVLVAGIGLRGWWLPRFALLSGGALLLGLALINPDAWVAQQNLDRYEATGRLDVDFLAGLSADAAPTLVALPGELRRCVLLPAPEADGFLGWNYGRARAQDVMDDVPRHDEPANLCPSQIGGD